MKKITLLIIGLFILSSCRPSMEQEIRVNVDLADQYFKKGLEQSGLEARESFFRSALAYEEAIGEGNLDNGYIYYNTGNSWFLAGEKGKAVYYFRKAEKKLPGNDIVQHNLQQARNAVLFNIQRKEINPIIKTLLFFHYDLGFNTKIYILLTLFSLLFSLASLMVFRKSQFIKNIIIFTVLLSFIVSASLVVDSFKGEEGVVITPIYGRKGDSKGYEKAFIEELSSGVEFEVKERRHGWLHIEIADGSLCWIPETAAIIIE